MTLTANINTLCRARNLSFNILNIYFTKLGTLNNKINEIKRKRKQKNPNNLDKEHQYGFNKAKTETAVIYFIFSFFSFFNYYSYFIF